MKQETQAREITIPVLDIVIILIVLGVHLFYLLYTHFVDWPEMLVYPWFLTKNLLYYRDIVLAYVPGTYYVLFVLYKLLGYSVRSERIIAYGFIFLTDLLVYLSAKKFTKSIMWASFSAAFFVFWQPILYGNTIWYETMLAPVYVLACIQAVSYIEKPSVRSAILLGLLFSVASLFKQTAWWSIGVICLYIWQTARDKYRGFGDAAIVGGIPLAANVLTWGAFALAGVGVQYLFWTYGFLLTLTRGNSMYALWPTRGDIIAILPAFIPLAVVSYLYRRKKVIQVIGLWTTALILAGLPRWGLFRLQPALAFAAVGTGVGLYYFFARKNIRVSVLLLVIGIVAAIGSWRSMRVFMTLRDPMQPEFFGKEYERMLEFVRTEVDGPFFVMGNDDYIYFGLNRTPTVLPWVPLFPWNADVPGVQQRIIASLDAKSVQDVLYVPYNGSMGYYQAYEPKELNLYITKKYEKITPLPAPGAWLYGRK